MQNSPWFVVPLPTTTIITEYLWDSPSGNRSVEQQDRGHLVAGQLGVGQLASVDGDYGCLASIHGSLGERETFRCKIN